MSTWFLKSKTPNNKEKKKINNSIIHNLNTNSYLNIYNPFNNIKFKKEKKKEKKLPSTWFHKTKVPYKKKKKKEDKWLHNPYTKY